MDTRIARALNRLGEDADHLAADEGLLDLLQDYFDPDDQQGNTKPCA